MTSWVIVTITDEELIAEAKRRGLIAPEYEGFDTKHGVWSVTDDPSELRSVGRVRFCAPWDRDLFGAVQATKDAKDKEATSGQ